MRLHHFYIITLLALASCYPTQTTTRVDHNLASIYNPNVTAIHPDYSIYHTGDSTSILTIRVKSNELLYNQANTYNQLASKVAIRYELYALSDTANQTLADTGRRDFDILRSKVGSEFYMQIPFKAKYPYQYTMRIFFYDLIRTYYFQAFVDVNKKDKSNSQNFRAYSGLIENKPVFNNIIYPGDSVRIESRVNAKVQQYFIFYYKKRERYNPIDAGFTTDILKNPDSVWKISSKSNIFHHFPAQGTYIIRTDSLCINGYTLHNFGESYPNIQHTEEMIGPLTYLTSIDEYRRITKSARLKNEIDNFWLKSGGSSERAREMIKIYYNRVKYANTYFTSDREGWMTDRGMIFVLYGPPAKLFKSDDEEKWIYTRNNVETSFPFRKRENPFSDNDYILTPSNTIETSIDETIDLWVQGKILF